MNTASRMIISNQFVNTLFCNSTLKFTWLEQRILAYFVRGSFTAQLTSSLFCLDSAALLMWYYQQIYLLGKIQTSQTGSQPYSNTSPWKVNKHGSAAIAPWFRQCLPYSGTGFESQAFQSILLKLYMYLLLEWEKDENKKRGLDWPIKKVYEHSLATDLSFHRLLLRQPQRGSFLYPCHHLL